MLGQPAGGTLGTLRHGRNDDWLRRWTAPWCDRLQADERLHAQWSRMYYWPVAHRLQSHTYSHCHAAPTQPNARTSAGSPRPRTGRPGRPERHQPESRRRIRSEPPNDHELVKVRARMGDRAMRDEILDELARTAGAEIIQRVGHVALVLPAQRRETRHPAARLSPQP